MSDRHDNRRTRPRQSVPRTRVWFENGRLMTNNPAAFAAAFELPATPPTDDGRVVVSHPTPAVKGGGR